MHDVAGPDKYLAPLTKPRPGRKLKRVDQLWPKAGRLLVSERLWLETNRVIAMRSDAKVLSNVWWPVLLEDTSAEKALAVWLNSSLGLLTILAQRTTTRGGWVAMKKADLEQLPVLDTNRLSPSQLKRWLTCSTSWRKRSSSACPQCASARPAAPSTTAYHASWASPT